ncbi:copper resistance CopC/CopD family protein [Priestia koreensis]|uniref:copper resistance CopC/CopD family protein n=1 Tax=Priestia koreensis TaxID=284581 RepID=UPI00203FE635|nr:copper resistance CopC/CopD family protein [Priestia koreensis]MCM3004974.1 copper resistance CopC/CopD family protein [Priestia koreensis]
MHASKTIKSLLVFILLLVMFTPLRAYAHAYIQESNPSENERLKQSPTEVKIKFNEELQNGFNSLSIVDSNGKRVKLEKAEIKSKDRSMIQAKVEQKLKDDVYSLEWRVVSADGHSVSGNIPFLVGKTSKEIPSSFQQSNGTSSALKVENITDRWFLYSSFSIIIGVLLFRMFWYRPEKPHAIINKRTKNLLWIGLSLLTIAILAFLPIQTKLNAGVSWSKAFDLELLSKTLQYTKEGTVWMIQIVILLLLFVSTWWLMRNKEQFSRIKASFSLALIVGMMLSKAFIGHPSSSPYKEFGVGTDFLHLLSASIWVGGILAIVFLLHEGMFKKDEESRDLYWQSLNRFSIWGWIAVGTLMLTGIFNATLFITDIQTLIRTTYGRALLIKVGGFVLMGILGMIHFIRVKYFPNKGLKWAVRVELLIGLAIFAFTAVFTNLPTPQGAAPQSFNDTAILIDNKEYLNLNISPKRPGPNTFEVTIYDQRGRALKDIEQVTITISQQGLFKDGRKSTFQVPEVSEGVYETNNLYLNQKGRWKIQVHVLTKSLDEYDAYFSTNLNR